MVYFKGCTLGCLWCHNPESISRENEIMFNKNLCVNCGRCVTVCPKCHFVAENTLFFSRENCLACGKCAGQCPTRALTVCGSQVTVEEVLAEIEKDKHYFDKSGGGVTLSGGEPLIYSEFSAELLKKCKSSGINTVVETALNVPWGAVDMVKNCADAFFVDLKHHDGRIHKKLTGAGNSLIIENIEKLSQVHRNITIRIPLIPGVNDGDDNLVKTAAIINRLGDGIRTVELLKYNNLAAGKYESVGKTGSYPNAKPQTDSEMSRKNQLLRSCLENKPRQG